MVTRNPLTSGSSTGNALSYTTDSITPTAKSLVLAFVVSFRPPLQGTPAPPTLSGNGLQWQQVRTVLGGAQGNRRLSCFRAMGAAPTAGPVTLDFGDQSQDLCAWSLVEFTDVHTGGTAGAGAIAQSQVGESAGSGLTLTLQPSADPTRNATVGAVMVELTTAARQVTPGVGFTEIHEVMPRQTLQGATLQTQAATTGLTTAEWTWAGTEDAAAIVVELTAPPLTQTPTTTADPMEILARRFEPVLFFHPNEAFYPCDAKRFVEAAQLWTATAPFDSPGRWGGPPGTPFPRQPEVPAGQLRGLPTEGGTFLGGPGLLTAGPNDERFLALGGWKDKDEVHHTGVFLGKVNTYADRTEIADRYTTDLEPSRYWYHAELFDTTRLTRLASGVTAPNLSRIVAQLTNPVLLCYYLFFPAHEESVGGGTCPNIEAKEVGGHAGDWQCVALLLEGDGTGQPNSFTPRFFGHTGLRPAAARPHAFDGEDRTVMTVEQWRAGSPTAPIQPELNGDHPRFYVARGSHSLYTAPGPHDVAPYPDPMIPTQCGRFDAPPALPAPESDNTPVWVLLAKLVAGGLLGAVFQGYTAALLEGVLTAGGNVLPTDPPGDPANPDQAPAAAGDGRTVKPANLTVPDAGPDVEDWRSQEDLLVNARTYGFLVDRATQVWWPSDDLQQGFRGRWGQRVADDPVPRRCGPTFPEYWKMFLAAVADGDATGMLTL
ncbi:hypothetical protein [Mycolicibacterium monacense]|uniref:hypothetical protein n=1 Tax=Mycolicibacterium monacense TaxID=85693 RepID=UPI0007EC2740|nr:hypothetical protein [Mycolicibacterium monacense]OBB76193.1 hypothetical protein A6B34_12500 [Mycolicibacterium monacense]